MVKVPLATPGVLVDQTDDNGRTALMYAAGRGFLEITPLLLDAGASRDVQDNSRKSARDHASDLGYLNSLKFKAQLVVH